MVENANAMPICLPETLLIVDTACARPHQRRSKTERRVSTQIRSIGVDVNGESRRAGIQRHQTCWIKRELSVPFASESRNLLYE